jgi:hypothetical protein
MQFVAPRAGPHVAVIKTGTGQAQEPLHKNKTEKVMSGQTDTCMSEAKGEFYKDKRKLRSKIKLVIILHK